MIRHNERKCGFVNLQRTPDIICFNEKKYLLNYTEAL